MSRNNDDYVATKAEQTFNDEGETIKQPVALVLVKV